MNVSLDAFIENTLKDKHTYILSFALLFAISYLNNLEMRNITYRHLLTLTMFKPFVKNLTLELN